MTSNEVLQEILDKIENREDVRAFCPDCGQMRMLTCGWVPCPYGCGEEWCDGWEGYTCAGCFYRHTFSYDNAKDLIEYNKMRFSV